MQKWRVIFIENNELWFNKTEVGSQRAQQYYTPKDDHLPNWSWEDVYP